MPSSKRTMKSGSKSSKSSSLIGVARTLLGRVNGSVSLAIAAVMRGKLEMCEAECYELAAAEYRRQRDLGATEQQALSAYHDTYVACMRECMA